MIKAPDACARVGRKTPSGEMMRNVPSLVAAAAILMVPAAARAQSAREVIGAPATTAIEDEPAAKLIVDQPLPGALAHGRVILQYRAENMRLLPVFGQAALAVSPRIGHVHVTVDDNPWKLADASGEALIINGLPPGAHHILVELENANHQTVDKKVVAFVIPSSGAGPMSHM